MYVIISVFRNFHVLLTNPNLNIFALGNYFFIKTSNFCFSVVFKEQQQSHISVHYWQLQEGQFTFLYEAKLEPQNGYSFKSPKAALLQQGQYFVVAALTDAHDQICYQFLLTDIDDQYSDLKCIKVDNVG